MMNKALIVLLTLALVTGIVFGANSPQAKSGKLITPITFDTFDDTIKYDDNQIQWWFGGLTNFLLATKFTPLANFQLQKVLLAMADSSSVPITAQLKADSSGYPGGPAIWTGTLVYNTPYTWRYILIDTTGLPQYTFAGGSNFWLTISSAGPPFEIYDPSPVQPPRSKTYDPDQLGGWVNSPGDNFICAVGEYTGGIVDVGCDSIWHGQNFHLPNPGTLTIGARVKNYGTNPATFQVACSLFTEGSGPSGPTYTFYSALTPQTVTSLAAGASTNVTFPAAAISVSNRYRIRARTLLSGDPYADNNAMDTETQTYTAPAELRYDDDFYGGAAYSSTVGAGWAMKFNPHQTGNYGISSIKIMTSLGTGDLAARVQVLDDNGTGGAPSAILWQTVQVMANGWNTFNVNLAGQSGSFYVAYIFENGASTSALRMDDYPSSGMGWTRSSGTAAWLADPSGDDWMMRASISGGLPNVTVTLLPVNPPIIIPPTGGPFDWDITLHNGEATPTVIDIWNIIQGPPTRPGWGPVLDLSLPAGATVNRIRTQYVSDRFPAGAYTYISNIGEYPGTVWDSDSFPFTKAAIGADGWASQPTPGLIPTEYALHGAMPNPFNPTTTVSFALPQSGQVKLSVYNVSGREVATLVNGWRDAGNHEVTFDASKLASGLYVYQLSAGDFQATGKMVLMK